MNRTERFKLRIDTDRLMEKLNELAKYGARTDGGCNRLAFTSADGIGRNCVLSWMEELGLEVRIDGIGNVVALKPGQNTGPPVMIGSHIDTVATGGRYDGNLGVLAGLEVINSLNLAGITPYRPIAVAFFSNEEGCRVAPDMMGSLVYAGGLPLKDAQESITNDGKQVADELQRIGYLGDAPSPGEQPYAYIELHIEQGPILENEGYTIGAVTGVQGISWREISVEGEANHAGTCPMALRHDAGFVAGEITSFVRRLTKEIGGTQVGTVGSIQLKPNQINVIPHYGALTIDLRNTDEALLSKAENRLDEFLAQIAHSEGVKTHTRQIARFKPVDFNPQIVALVENIAVSLGNNVRRLPAGAGHDAQMLARICPSGMIFTPSARGISHNPSEHTTVEDIERGANVLLQVVLALSETKEIALSRN